MNNSLVKGSIFALLAFFGMAVFGVFTKIAIAHGGEFWVSFISYLSGTLVLTPLILYHGVGFLKTERFTLHFGRAAFGLMASFLYMLSLNHIPIVNATLFFNTAPIFIPLLSIWWLKAFPSRSTWLAVALGFVGIIIIIKPSLAIFNQPGDLLGLFSGISLAIAYMLIKMMADVEPRLRIVYYYLFLGTCFQLPLLLYAGELPSQTDCLWAILAGVALAFAQVCLVEGYRYAEAAQVGVYQYSSVVFVGIIQWLVWDLVPAVIDILGVGLVILAGVIIIRESNKKTNAGPQ